MNRWFSLGVMMTFFCLLPLDIDVPAFNLCLMALMRWSLVAGLPAGLAWQRQAWQRQVAA